MARRKALLPNEPSHYTEKSLKAFAADVKSGRLPVLDRLRLTDDMVTGLRVHIFKDGTINFLTNYHFGDHTKRHDFKIGELTADSKSPDHLSLENAREITKIIQSLSLNGIDVQDGMRRRLIRELLRDGRQWRPDKK